MKQITASRADHGCASEEVASALVERRAFDALWTEKEQWRDGYERVCGAFELSMDITECHQAIADYAGIVYDVVLGDLADRLVAHESELAASHESQALLEAERLTWLRANSEVAALNIDLIVELSDLKDAVRAYLSAPISRRGASWARLKELTKDE